jgi:antitoxin ParD1/3/4
MPRRPPDPTPRRATRRTGRTGRRTTPRTTLNVSLPERQRKLVDEVVCAGEYGSASEVVRDSLRVWEAERRTRRDALAWLRAEIRKGTDSLDRGEWHDADDVFDELEREILKPRRTKQRRA